MAKKIKADICVIGAGSGGLSVAAGAAQMGARTVLIERGEMGGDCLKVGAALRSELIAAARRAYVMRESEAFGIEPMEPRIDFAKVNAHVKGVIAAIAPNDSVARFEGLGVTVLKEHARFRDGRTVIAGNREIHARRFVIATGSHPAIPPIAGLDTVPFLTNETIFEQTTRPDHLIVIGGGPIGMEMAQAHRRLGCKVTVIEAAKVLAKDDPEGTSLIIDRLIQEGDEILEGVKVEEVSGTAGRISVRIADASGARAIEGTHLLVATGRKPNVDDLDLDKAGVTTDAHGIKVDDQLRTANKRIFAIGDVIGGMQFTHVANYHAGIVIRNAFFRLPAKAAYGSIPYVT
jgi:pyruvate/2-oxoglutarate dehydrogenase complex dihydrolipoamide dehydrogenase (E3) component